MKIHQLSNNAALRPALNTNDILQNYNSVLRNHPRRNNMARSYPRTAHDTHAPLAAQQHAKDCAKNLMLKGDDIVRTELTAEAALIDIHQSFVQ